MKNCRCQNCGNLYNVDLLVPDELWKRISPNPVEGYKGGGLLCGMCIMQRIEAFGIDDYFYMSKP